jgi:hypothetical protein
LTPLEWADGSTLLTTKPPARLDAATSKPRPAAEKVMV